MISRNAWIVERFAGQVGSIFYWTTNIFAHIFLSKAKTYYEKRKILIGIHWIVGM